MIALLLLYQWTIAAGVAAAPALTLLGAQLATRDRAMQTLCVGQGAMVGVLLGIGLLHSYEGTWIGAVGPFMSALIVSASTFLATDILVAKKVASKNTTFAFVFGLLLAASYLIGALFPALESHMAQIYFGDLATLTIFDSKVTLGASLLSLLVLVARAKAISNQSFEWAIFGDLRTKHTPRFELAAFKVLTLVILCFSVQFVGFLFTISMLFLPTAMMNFLETKGLRLHLGLSAGIAAAGTVVGFVLSLNYTRLPTVPAIVAVMFLLGLVLIGGERLALSLARLKAARTASLEPAHS